MSRKPGPPPSKRLPFTPLAQMRTGRTMTALADAVGVTRRTMHRWQRFGVPVEQADRVAIRLGAHPLELWPEFYEVAA